MRVFFPLLGEFVDVVEVCVVYQFSHVHLNDNVIAIFKLSDRDMGNALDDVGSEKSEKSMFSFGKEDTLCGELSYKTRVIGWLACSIAGWLLSIIVSLVFVLSGFDVVAYALLYSLGQILNIAGSCFLSTPSGHLKDMTKKHRIIPSIVYILSIILTIVIAVATEIRGLVFLFLIIQVFAYYWYTISFIPFGQKIVKKMCECCIDAI